MSKYWDQLLSREEVWRWSQTATQSYQSTFVCVIIIREISQLVRAPSPAHTSVRLHPVRAKSRYSVSGGRSWSPSTAASWSSAWRRVWTLGSTPARSAPSTSPSWPTTSTSEVRTARRSWTGTMFWDSVCFTAFCSSGRANKVSTQCSAQQPRTLALADSNANMSKPALFALVKLSPENANFLLHWWERAHWLCLQGFIFLTLRWESICDDSIPIALY